MEVFQSTGKKRETYQVKLDYSLLWESALGIAAITNKPLQDTLEKTREEWQAIKERLPVHTNHQLLYTEKNNTWKSILQILHQGAFESLHEFIEYIEGLTNDEFKFICLPFLGEAWQEERKRAAKGDLNAIIRLQQQMDNHSFLPAYIQFIADVDPEELRTHLIDIMTGWHQTVVEQEAGHIGGILRRDYHAKGLMLSKMDAEEFVEWATGGITYMPEPNVHQVLLIPHYTFRPWNMEADIEGTKVFYYPVANESIHSSNPYQPDQMLVQKYKVLGDENRMKIVKMLAEKDRTLHDLARLLDMGKSTTHHHLKQLKEARLVENKGSNYVLKKPSIDALGKEMNQFLNIK